MKRYVIEVYQDSPLLEEYSKNSSKNDLQMNLYGTLSNTFTTTYNSQNMNVRVLGEYTPSLGGNVSTPNVTINNDFSKLEEMLKMCCNCQNNKQVVYFDTISTDKLELSLEFKNKVLSNLLVKDYNTLIEYYKFRNDSSLESAKNAVDRMFKNYPFYTVSQCLDYWF